MTVGTSREAVERLATWAEERSPVYGGDRLASIAAMLRALLDELEALRRGYYLQWLGLDPVDIGAADQMRDQILEAVRELPKVRAERDAARALLAECADELECETHDFNTSMRLARHIRAALEAKP